MKEKILEILLAGVSGKYLISDARDKLVALLESECERARGEERQLCVELAEDCQTEHNEVRHGNTPDDAYERVLASLTHTKL